jgi:hypothetical protein
MMIKNSLRDLKQFLLGSKKRILFSIWVLVIIFICLMWAIGENVNDRTVSISTLFSGLSTFVFWCYRKKIAPIIKRWSATPRTKFILIGSFGAVWVEFIFWLLEKIFGAVGVAASPNFILDLIATMPWYILMIVLLWRIETTYRYTFTELLLLGGVYELGADGFIGSFLEGTLSLSTIPPILFLIPLFVVVYSFMILPCSSLLKEEIDRIREEKVIKRRINKYIYGILPLIGLIPYFILGILTLI